MAKKIIETEEQLRSHIPNIISSVKGETPLIERLSLFLELAEEWVVSYFTGETTYNTICGYTDANPTKILVSRLVVAEALRRAIPSLDVVLTPNGFGVISTNNLAPASKPRIDRLATSMQQHRDECITALLPVLPEASKWLSSERGSFFGATLFPDMSIVDAVGATYTDKWQKYLELRSQIIDLEASLAEDWFSPELMTALRDSLIRGHLSGMRKDITKQIQAQLVAYLREGSFNARRLADIVNFIRSHPGDFSEWHHSDTAALFNPPVFVNRKEAHGYFF